MEGVNLRDRLIAYRADRGWSQARLVEESGVSGATIAHIETGANKRPRRITLMRLAQAFGVSLDDFLSDGPPKKAPQGPEVPSLEVEAMYVADGTARRRALEAASDEERERYVSTIERVSRDVFFSVYGDGDWGVIATDESKPESVRRVAREQLARTWLHIERLAEMHAEATDDKEPPQEVLAEFIADHAGVGAG